MSNSHIPSRPNSRYGTNLVYVLAALVLVAYFALRIVNLSPVTQDVKLTSDTTAYLRISQEPVFTRDFLASSRPVFFPLVVKLLGPDTASVAWAQGIFSMLSWSILAISVASSLRIFLLRLAAFGLILLLSLSRYIIGWDAVMLTESLSLSFLALFIAGWLWLLMGWSWVKVLSLFIVSFLWVCSRDTNAWVLLMIAVILLLLFALGHINRRYLFISAAFATMFALSNLSADLGERWVFPFQNVLGHRLLPDPGAVDFFAACSMPVSAELMQMKGQQADGRDRLLYVDPALEEYRSWLYQDGKSCYMKWLLSNPVQSFQQPLDEFNVLMGIQKLQPFLFPKRFSPILPGRLESLLYPRQQPLLLFVIISVITILAILSKAWMKEKTAWVPFVSIALVLPHYLLVWHGDTLGIERHMVAASIQLYLGSWILLLFILDAALKTLTDPLPHENRKEPLRSQK